MSRSNQWWIHDHQTCLIIYLGWLLGGCLEDSRLSHSLKVHIQ
jgi:hypothetical protein